MLPNHVCDMIEIFYSSGLSYYRGISLMRDIPFPRNVCEPAVQPLLTGDHDSLQEDKQSDVNIDRQRA